MKVIMAVDSASCIKPFVNFAMNQKWGEPVSFKLINVVEPLLVGSYMSVFPSPFLEDMRADMFARGKSVMKELKDQLSKKFSDAEIIEQSLEGFPARTIAREATDWEADLIMTATHGRSGFNRVMIGSISAEIASLSPCSVLVLNLKHGESGEQSESEQSQSSESKDVVKSANC